MDGGLGIVIFFTILYIVFYIKDSKKKEEDNVHFNECIKANFKTLWMKWNQKVYCDDYGRFIYDDWIKEVEYFIINIAFPNEDYYMNRPLLNERIKQFNIYWIKITSEYLDKTENEQTIKMVVKNGIDYENFVEKYLQNLGYNVIRTPKTGDQGVDLIAEKDNDRKAIQCKYYSRPVGNKAVQEVITGANFYQCTSAAVISNSSFTKSAQQLAQNSNVELFNILP